VAASATLNSVSPASVPVTTNATTYQIVLSGTGFIGGDSTTRSKVGIASSSVLGVANVSFSDTNVQVTSVSQSTIYVTLNIPATGVSSGFTVAAPGTILLGVCNPGVCPVDTGVVSLTVGSVPTIQSVTSASSFQQVSGANTLLNTQNTSAYDMLSIFGSNFCPSCTSATILQGKPDAITLAYPLSLLSPDATNSLSVTFQTTTGSPPTLLGTAPLLFASNGQINLLVPGALSTGAVDAVVNFGATPSAPYHLTVANASPGLFTIGADGQGSGAILNTSYALVSATAPGGMRKTSNSDSVSIYMTGLGAPDSLASNTTTGTSTGAVWGTDCVRAMGTQAQGAFLYYLDNQISTNGGTPPGLTPSLDGVVLPSSLLAADRLVPCFVQADIAPTAGPTPAAFSVSIGGQAAPITYIGWTPDSIAGLFQVNVTLPPNTTNFTDTGNNTLNSIVRPVQLPIVVTAKTKTSQNNVSVWVMPRLTLTKPTNLFGPINVVWDTTGADNVVVAADGTSGYHFAVTTGTMPAGLALDASLGTITGTPTVLGQYPVTVTVTDSAATAVSDTVQFNLIVGLALSLSGGPTYTPVYSTTAVTVTVVTAGGGASPYAFSLAGTPPAGMSAVSTAATTAAVKIASTPAGTYTGAKAITVQATDNNGVVTTISLPMTIALNVTSGGVITANVTGTVGNPSIATVAAAGATGAVTYTLDDGAGNTAGFAVDLNSGVVSLTANTANTITYTLTITAHDAGTAPNAVAASHATGSTQIAVTVQ
jgi:uncharacterized protein (TIGR03437 family)